MKLDRLIQLRDDGTLDELYQGGIITPRVYVMLETNIKIRSLINEGYKRGDAVKHMAKVLRLTPKAIYAYLKQIEC